MTIETALQDYFDSTHQMVDGWFYPLDMVIFSQLDQIQKANSFSGDICELGVYKGKSLIYLKLLSRSPEKVFAFDLYPDELLEETQRNVTAYGSVPGTGDVIYVAADSTSHTVDSLRQHFINPVRILHIDAGHEYHEVLQSLYAFVPFVSNQGIVIMDDYQDRDFPGIESAVHQFTKSHSPRRFVPFAAGGNKMYMCNAAMALHYQLNLLNHPNLKDQFRLTRIEDYFVLIAATKLPMSNTQIERLLQSQAIPYEYDVDEGYMQRQAKTFGQYSPFFTEYEG